MEPITQDDATKIAHEWINKNVPRSTEQRPASQKHWLMEQLAPLCIAETIKQGGNARDLYQHLSAVLHILESIWAYANPKYANRKHHSEPIPKEERELAKHVIWRRHNPALAFREGYKSDNYLKYSGGKIFHIILAEYLKRPWLRHPYVDWIFMDIMITGEICTYGETIKEAYLPGKILFGTNRDYTRAKGNIETMRKLRRQRYINWSFFFGFIPASVIWSIIQNEWVTLSIIILSLYALIIIPYLLVKIVRLIRGIICITIGKADPRDLPFQTWESMHNIWRIIEGPVINPTMLKDQMQKTEERGAPWDAPSWALLDRIIQADPAVWIIEDGLSSPKDRVETYLRYCA